MRACICFVVVLALLLASGAVAKDAKADRPHKAIATVVKTDVANHTLIVKFKGKDGKEQERKIELKEGVKLIGEDGKEDQQAEFFKDLKPGEEVVIAQKNDKIVAVHDLPPRAVKSDPNLHREFAIVVRSDAAKHTLTVKMKGREGKEQERTIELKEGIKMIGEDGKEDPQAEFLRGLEGGEQILIVERERRIVELRDLPPRKKQ
jgi:nitrous oxide reductase